RRHTTCKRDWGSDVCSPALFPFRPAPKRPRKRPARRRPPGAGKPGRFSWTEYTAFCPPVQAAGRGQSVTGLKKEGKTKLRFLTKGAWPSTMGAGGPELPAPRRSGGKP